MALFDWGELTNITRRYIIPELQDAIFKSNPLFLHLYQRGRAIVDGGTRIEEPVLIDAPVAEAYSRYQTATLTPKELTINLKLDWKFYRVNIPVDGPAEVINAGQQRVMDYISVLMQAAELKLRDLLGTDLFAATQDAKKIDTLQIAIDSSGTYAEIDRSVYSAWAANEMDAAGAAPSRSLFQEMYGKCTQGTTSPDLIVTTQRIFDQLWEITAAQQRYDQGDEFTIGAPYIRHNRARIMVDSHCPAGHAYFINTDFVVLKMLQGRNFYFSGWMPSTTQDARVAYIYWAGNVVVQNPRFMGKITGMSES
jgi:hypothetical protein